MIRDVRVVLWKEWRELLGMQSNQVGMMVVGFITIILMVYASTWRLISVEVLESPFVLGSVYFSLIIASSLSVDAFAGERERHTLETILASRLVDEGILFGKMLAISLFGWAVSFVIPLALLLEVNLRFLGSAPHFYHADIFLGLLGLGFLVSVFGASAGCVASVRASSMQQANIFMLVTMSVPLIIPMVIRFALPEEQLKRVEEFFKELDLGQILWVVAAFFISVNIAFILIARGLFKRSRLIVSR